MNSSSFSEDDGYLDDKICDTCRIHYTTYCYIYGNGTGNDENNCGNCDEVIKSRINMSKKKEELLNMIPELEKLIKLLPQLEKIINDKNI